MKRSILFTALLSWVLAVPLQAADHLDAPDLDGRGELDINDLYAFQSPTNANNTVLILTVNPLAGIVSGTDFGTTDVGYEFLIDNDGDAMSDVSYETTFSHGATGQHFTLMKNGTTIASGVTGMSAPVATGGMVQAGLFDDPFFFDLNGFNDGLAFTGDDTLAGADVSAIVLEIPRSELGGDNIGIWARTTEAGMQVDRIGRPAINTVLIPSARKDEFNVTTPAQDFAVFGDDVNATITSLSDQANADALTGILLPDLLTINTSDASGFLNGRGLADDVIDAELNLLTTGGITGDGVDMNDVPFQDAFPFLAQSHAVPEPSSLSIWIIGIVTLAGFRRRKSK